MIYAQVLNGRVNLVGCEEVGLPLPQDILDAFPHIQCFDVTDMEQKPSEGDYYIDGVFMNPLAYASYLRGEQETGESE